MDCHLEIICSAPQHGLTIYQLLAWSDVNCRRSYLETKSLQTNWWTEAERHNKIQLFFKWTYKNWWNLPMSNPKADLNILHQCKYQIWRVSTEIYSSYCFESKIRMYCWQITVKNGRNLSISNPKAEVHNINAHTKFGENPLTFTYLCM